MRQILGSLVVFESTLATGDAQKTISAAQSRYPIRTQSDGCCGSQADCSRLRSAALCRRWDIPNRRRPSFGPSELDSFAGITGEWIELRLTALPAFCEDLVAFHIPARYRGTVATNQEPAGRRAHAFSSRLSSLKKRQSAPSAMIFCGLTLIKPASRMRNA